MKRRQTLLPPTDEELAAAERTQLKRDNDALAAREDEQKQIRFAAAGDPDAIAALATALKGRPVENESAATAGTSQMAKTISRRISGRTSRDATKAGMVGTVTAEIGDEAAPAMRVLPTDAESAYALMDLVCQKWKVAAFKDVRKADRELARDLLGDAAIYVKTGTMRLGDILDAKIKLSALGKVSEEEKGGGDMEEKLNDLRKALRGE